MLDRNNPDNNSSAVQITHLSFFCKCPVRPPWLLYKCKQLQIKFIIGTLLLFIEMSTNCLTIPPMTFRYNHQLSPNSLHQLSTDQQLKISNFSFAIRTTQKEADCQLFQDKKQENIKQTLSKCLSSPQLQKNSQNELQKDSYRKDYLGVRNSNNKYKNSEVTTISDASQTLEEHTRGGYHINICEDPHLNPAKASPTFKYFRRQEQNANRINELKYPYDFDKRQQFSDTGSSKCISQINLVTSPKLQGVSLKDYLSTANAAREMTRLKKRSCKQMKRYSTQTQQLKIVNRKSSDCEIESNLTNSVVMDSRTAILAILKKQITGEINKFIERINWIDNKLDQGGCSRQEMVKMCRTREMIKGCLSKLEASYSKLLTSGGYSSRVNIILQDESECVDL